MLAQLKLIRNAIQPEAGEYVDAKEVHGTLMLAEHELPDGTSAFALFLIGPESQVIPVANDVDPQRFVEPTYPDWQVRGDHPVAKRPDRGFKGKMAQCEAQLYAAELKGLGYENVTCEEVTDERR